MSRNNKRKHPHTAQSQIDVVVTTGGRFDLLEKCLTALYHEAQTTSLSIFLIDNASNAEERIANAKLFEYHPEDDPTLGVKEFRSKRLTQSIGFPDSNNEGARLGHAPLILFLNDDVELQDGAIASAVKRFEDATIGVVGAKLIFPPTSTSPIRPAGKVQHVGVALNIRGEPVHPLVGWSADNPRTNVSRDVFAVTGAFLMVRRAIFQKVGGFNSIYGMGTWEDVELCMMVRQAGLRVFVDTESIGYHYVGATQEKKQVNYPLHTNRLIFQSRWANSGLMQWSEMELW